MRKYFIFFNIIAVLGVCTLCRGADDQKIDALHPLSCEEILDYYLETSVHQNGIDKNAGTVQIPEEGTVQIISDDVVLIIDENNQVIESFHVKGCFLAEKGTMYCEQKQGADGQAQSAGVDFHFKPQPEGWSPFPPPSPPIEYPDDFWCITQCWDWCDDEFPDDPVRRIECLAGCNDLNLPFPPYCEEPEAEPWDWCFPCMEPGPGIPIEFQCPPDPSGCPAGWHICVDWGDPTKFGVHCEF